jgi:hypothetical protein
MSARTLTVLTEVFHGFSQELLPIGTSPTSGGRSVGMICLRTETMAFIFSLV